MRLIARAKTFPGKTAVVDEAGDWTYGELLAESAALALHLLDGALDLEEEPIAFMAPPGFAYVALQWGIWRAGGIAVPLCLSHPAPELAHVLDDAGIQRIFCTAELRARLTSLAEEPSRSLETLEISPPGSSAQPVPESEPNLPEIGRHRRAGIIYTSGTTGKPKGVVSTHGNLEAQIEALVEAWRWTPDDHILNVLPLHHVHGIVNVLACALWSGAVWETLSRFDAEEVWRRIESRPLTLFMAVPTVYHRLIQAFDTFPTERQALLSEAARGLRLMVSGSAALPIPTLERWQEITGHVLLERYGMTEIGMALSNPYEGSRVPGHVGQPLPGVEIRRVDADGSDVAQDVEEGELLVRGAAVFKEYWKRPQETLEAFSDGWFATGDVAVVEEGSYRLLGRSSVDILKTGGYKISALEIEAVLRQHPSVEDCAIVGLPDPQWGQLVACAAVPGEGSVPSLEDLQSWARDRLAPYKVPRKLLWVEDLPRNALGKVVKPRVTDLF